jgi:hypothetical protein
MIALSGLIAGAAIVLFVVLKLFRVGTLKSVIASLLMFMFVEGLFIALLLAVGDH